MKATLLLLTLLLTVAPALAQPTFTLVNAPGTPTFKFGAPYYARPDTTGNIAGLIPTTATCQVVGRSAGWLKINYNGLFGYYTVARALRVADAPGRDMEKEFAGANGVVAHVADAPATAFVKMAQALLGRGYTLADKDKELLFMTTAPHPISGGVAVTVSVAIAPEGSGSTALLTSYYTSAANEILIRNASAAKVRVKKEFLGPMASLWGEMIASAAAYQGARLGYIQLP